MNKVAVITARGGSKRIPGKNIKPFLGKPIIAYSITAALESELFDEVMVSTDDPQIAAIAKRYGAVVPFMRSAGAANDFATTSDALIDVFDKYLERGQSFEYACCIYPTAPFVTAGKLINAYKKLIEDGVDTILPVIPFGYPVFRSLKIENNRLKMIWEQYRHSRSQDLPQAFHDAGQFYFFNVCAFLQNRTLLTENVSGVAISELEAQDIDNPVDWQLAEMKYKLLVNNYE